MKAGTFNLRGRNAAAIGADEAISAPSDAESIVIDGGAFLLPR
jgi:hypothetical protein